MGDSSEPGSGVGLAESSLADLISLLWRHGQRQVKDRAAQGTGKVSAADTAATPARGRHHTTSPHDGGIERTKTG